MQEGSIDLLKIARALWKNILLIALVALLFGAAAFGNTAFRVQPTYQSTVSLFVNKTSVNIGSTSISAMASETPASSSTVSIYLYILKSRTTLEEVIQEAGLSYSPGALSGMISSKTINGTSAFEVTVTSSNPSEAELIANTIAKVLPDRISEIVDGTSVRVVDYAIIPTSRSGPNLMKNTQMGMLAGAAVTAACIVLFTMLTDHSNDLIQSSDDLRGLYPEIMVLGVIPDMRVSDKRNGYYSSYYGKNDSRKKEGKKHG